MKRIAPILIAICLWATPALAQTRTWIGHVTWGGFGTPNPINASTGNYYLYPYFINAPNCFAILSTSGAPWNPNAVGTDYYVEATNGATCAGGGSPNPGQGINYVFPYPHRAIGMVAWIKRNGAITTTTFIARYNDCTHAATTGVEFGCIDTAAVQINGTTNTLQSDITGAGSPSAAVPTTWTLFEWCFIAGTNGSGTVPAKESAWLGGTQFITNTTAPTTAFGFGNGGITYPDYELGAGATMDFGPAAFYDSGTSCPASPLGTMYVTDGQPTANGTTINFTAAANANWQNAAAATPGSLSYNADAVASQLDIYLMSLGTYTNVLFVAQRASVEKTANGTRIAQLGWNISSTNYPCTFDNGFSPGGDTLPAYVGNALQIGTYQQIGCLSATDPSTGSAWSGAPNAGKIVAQVLR
jgi:hypothetical protein